MKIEIVPISTLSADPANVRQHNPRNVESIMASLRRFGQQKPIVVGSHNIVRAGNGTLAAAVALGWTEIKIVRSELADTELTAYAIADNRTAELAEWDDENLARLLSNSQIGDVGFDESEIKKLMNSAVPPDNANSASEIKSTFEVVVKCEDEDQQREVYERLIGEGLSCRLFTL